MRLFFWDSTSLFMVFRGGAFAPPERRVKILIFGYFFWDFSG